MLTVTLPPDVAEETVAKILEKQVIFFTAIHFIFQTYQCIKKYGCVLLYLGEGYLLFLAPFLRLATNNRP